MSGIAGIIHFDGKPAEPGLIEVMTSSMAHRGPDGIAHWVQGFAALGHCMLCTTPESLEERQPLANEDGSLVLVMDGRVDNWEELRSELLGRGAKLRTKADAELVLRAYEVWGADCLEHFDGDFALVIWDTRRRAAFCARDHMGNKPFNYHWDGETLVFASEVQAVLRLPWVPELLNEGMVAELLANERYSLGETFWQGVLRLESAHAMRVSASGLSLRRYWTPDLTATLTYKKESEYVEHYRELLLERVRRASRSHRPLACEVSGGLDSSAIFAAAGHLLHHGRLVAPAVEGYTMTFPSDPAANEVEFARAVAAHTGLPVQEIEPGVAPVSWYYERARADREFPDYPNGVVSLQINRRARECASRVLLTGLGGDEWLGDPWARRPYYAEELAARNWRALLDCIAIDLRAFGALRTARWFVRHGLAARLPTPLYSFVRRLRVPARRSAQLLSDELSAKLAERRTLGLDGADVATLRKSGRLTKKFALISAHMAWAVETQERSASRLGLEIRSPLRHPGLVSFSCGTPARLLTRGRIDKYLHRQALHDLLPPSVLARTDKAEFSGLFHAQLQGLGEEFDQITTARARWFGEISPRTLYDSFSQGSLSRYGLSRAKVQWILMGMIGCKELTAENPTSGSLDSEVST